MQYSIVELSVIEGPLLSGGGGGGLTFRVQ